MAKPTKWMAEALLAKLYINWAVYTCDDVATYDPSMTNSKLNDVIKYCDDIIASGHFNLSDGYRKEIHAGQRLSDQRFHLCNAIPK